MYLTFQQTNSEGLSMSQNILWIAIAISTLIAIFLLIYSVKMWQKINQLKQANTQIQESQDKVSQTTQLKAIESIKHIAQFMAEEQVELSEGCIRIKILLDHVAPELHEHPTFGIFNKMYLATEHMPTHEARKEADNKLIRKLDMERLKLEAENKEAIVTASKQLDESELLLGHITPVI